MTDERKKPSIAAAIDELRRNLEINEGRFKHEPFRKMRPEVAAMHQARLERAIELLQWLKANERAIKQRLAQ